MPQSPFLAPNAHPSSKALITAHISGWPVFPELEADVRFHVHSEITALIGRNGTGKTRLIRLLAGKDFWSGSSVTRLTKVGYLPQISIPSSEASIADHLEIAEGLAALSALEKGAGSEDDLVLLDDRWSLREDILDALARVGLPDLDLGRPISSLSGGEFTRAELVRLEISGADFLLLDEPTNHLDRRSKTWVVNFIKTWKSGMLVVSHDRDVLRVSDRVIELTSLGMTDFRGDYDEFLNQNMLESEAAVRALSDSQKALRRVTREVQTSKEKADKRRANGSRKADKKDMPKSFYDGKAEHAQNTMGRDRTRAALQMSRATDNAKLAAKRVERFQSLDFQLPTSGVKKGQGLVRLEDFSFRYPDHDDVLFQDLSLVLGRGDKIALVGENGSGKSTLLRLIGGDLETGDNQAPGVLSVTAKRVAYLDQKMQILEDAGNVMEAFTKISPLTTPGQAHAALARFLFRGDDAFKKVNHLSGGERLRAALAALLFSAEPPHLLLLDEPNNHLDLDSQEAVAKALAAFDGGLLIVSHDENFLADVGITARLDLGAR
jgi:ATPase subunit of ABC transporter with duplicated ATPase domains